MGVRYVQLRRTKGWRMPPNTIRCVRPGPLGNPLTIANAIESGFANAETAQKFVTECFGEWLREDKSGGRDWWDGPESDAARKAILDSLPKLRSVDFLGCWCKPGDPCHVQDVLIPVCESVKP